LRNFNTVEESIPGILDRVLMCSGANLKGGNDSLAGSDGELYWIKNLVDVGAWLDFMLEVSKTMKVEEIEFPASLLVKVWRNCGVYATI
jgi:hypothetical protein